jgi:hypothetical protein
MTAMPQTGSMRRFQPRKLGLVAALALVPVTGLALAVPAAADDRADLQNTRLISKSLAGGVPDGPSTNAVISGDRRYARVIAFESEATDLVAGDANGLKDVFAIKRSGTIANKGAPWHGGDAILVSRGRAGAPADGPSFGAAVSGDFHHRGRCIAFLSAATNLVGGDTNAVVDAFLVKGAGRRPIRISRPRRMQSPLASTAVAVSGDCSRASFVIGGELYTRGPTRHRTVRFKHVTTDGPVTHLSYATGDSTTLAFDTPSGVYLSRRGVRKPRLVAPGGANPAFNDLKRSTLAYEKHRDGHSQILYKDLGRRETVISDRAGSPGDGDSRAPVIGNSGYYVAFESEAANLSVNALGRPGDHNGFADSYLYTNVRDITLVQSVEEKAVPLPGGGRNPSMSYYANYVLFDSPAPFGSANQVFMRYLGPV